MANMGDDLAVVSASLFDEIQVRLFDSMSRLQQLRIDTPQLVVVGSQSSGKSSVLEALVRFHFPVDGAKPTTRFPIKLVLRKADKEMTRVRIELQSETSRSEAEKLRLRRLAEDLSGDRFDRIIEKAKANLCVASPDTPGEAGDKMRTFCDDVLVIERYGPLLPKLDLVDLPGLFDAESTGQTLEDAKMVRDMVCRYIKSPMNIILLVVSAEHDYSNVRGLGTLQWMRKEDPTLQKRVVCVITRPDKTGLLQETLRVLGEQNPFAQSFARPWHVLRNQDQEARRKHQALDERDRIEQQFFRQKDWEAVPPSQKGIGALRETLKSMIWTHTRDQLPEVISMVKAEIKGAEDQLRSAFDARATPEARRNYLSGVAEMFALLTREAVQGTFKNKRCEKDHRIDEPCRECNGFFAPYGDNTLESQQKRLRANVRALNRAFAAAMRQYGRTTIEIGDGGAPTGTNQPLDQLWQQDGDGEVASQLHRHAQYYVHDKPETKSRKEYEKWVCANTDRWKSLEPGREASDGAYWGLFAYQAAKWKRIATQHVKAVWLVVEEFIELALAASCQDKDVLDALRRELVDINLNDVQVKADRTLRDLVSCHGEANPGFYDSLADARAMREHAEAFLQRLAMISPESGDNAEASGSGTANAEQANGQQDAAAQQTNSTPRQGDTNLKPKSQHAGTQQRNTEHKAMPKDRSAKSREAILTLALENAIGILGNGYPILNNPLVRKSVVPIIAHHISAAFEPNSDSGTKEKPKRTETNAQKGVHSLFPVDSGTLIPANVISQVEMHYEAIQTSFVGYVASLVVEQRIMGQLPEAILTEKIVRDMKKEKVDKIAGERPQDAEKRKRVEGDLKTMREVLQAIEEYRRASWPATGTP